MLRKILLSLGLALTLTGNLATVQAADLSALSMQYSNDTFEALQSISVQPDFQYTARVKSIVDRLADALGQGKWTIVIYQMAKMPKDMDLPAFALPGNRIAVSDYEAKVASDNALGFMLAHEMGHVVLRHQNQAWQLIIRQTGIQPKSWTDLASHANGIESLSREQEFEADGFGRNLADLAGFDGAAGAKELLGRLIGDSLHPDPSARLAALGIQP
jgi:Zn-dependent protease with chaperone function